MTANSAIERQEVVGADGGELPVRTAKWGAGRFGFVAIAALAGLMASNTAAEAANGVQGSPCCDLASSNKCAASCSGGCSACYNYRCPSGYTKRYWWCYAGVRLIGCGECQTGGKNTTCWNGATYYCSIWWDDNACP